MMVYLLGYLLTGLQRQFDDQVTVAALYRHTLQTEYACICSLFRYVIGHLSVLRRHVMIYGSGSVRIPSILARSNLLQLGNGLQR